MDNINGALAFRATLDIDDFNVSAEAMERSIKKVSDSAMSDTEALEQQIMGFAQRGASYITSYLVGQGMQSLLQSIISTRGQFQQLEIAFNTMLGSTERAQALMSQLVDTAAHTPFDLNSIASGAKQMLAFGSSVENVVNEILMLGNVASGVSAPLNDIIYLYGTLRSQGRAYTVDIRQFAGRGIPIYEELEKVMQVNRQELNKLIEEGKVGFPQVEQAFKNMTSEGGLYFNLMQEQSKSLTGMISNLGDAWDMALNKIGQDNQDVFAAGIQAATDIVENFDTIIRILEAVAIAYGTYKAAVVANTLVTKGFTGVALIDNTVRSAKIALLKLEAQATGQVTAQNEAMTTAQAAHTAALEASLSAEELANVQRQVRIATIQTLLTEQQKEYLSNLNLTTSSAGYEAAATSVMSVEQRLALQKVDLTAKGATYRAALEQEVAAKRQSQAASLDAMRTEVKLAAQKMESARAAAVAAKAAVDRSYYEVYRAQQTGNAEQIAIATKKMEAAEDNAAITRKAALAAQSDFYAKKKTLETAAINQSRTASAADAAAKTVQGMVTTALTAVTNKCTLAVKTLWATMKSNPLGWILTIIGMVVSAITLFKSSNDEATDAMGEFQDTTKKQIDNLDLLFAILQNTEKGTKTHGDAIEKINQICKEYNKTLLDENATLDEQKGKYEELTTAIQNATAEKIKAKYVEQEMQKYLEASNENFDTFVDRSENTEYDTGNRRTVYSGGSAYEVPVMAAADNIRNMGSAVQEAIRSQVEEAAKALSTMSGDAFTQEYNRVVSAILNSTQAATKATDAEIAGFKGNIETYLNDQIVKAKDMQTAIGRLNEQLSAYFAPKDTKPVTESVDLVEMSFEDLEKKADDAQKKIDEINAKEVKVQADYTELQRLQTILNDVNTAISTKTANLNTEAGINARIKQLKDERANVVINSDEYKNLSKEIDKLSAKLPQNKSAKQKNNDAKRTADQAKRNSENLRKAQEEADRKLEEARISIMEEGYEKRKAQLDLQHREELKRIDKEEKELENARKKAGKGGLTKEETANFNERRQIENESYEKEQANLFDGELDYKKKQYELYFRWVRSMGQDVADKQFASLLKSGNSYKEYVERQLAALTVDNGEPLQDRQGRADLTAGQVNMLNGLKTQYNEIMGVKSAMDLFKESVRQSVSQAQNLAEKIQAIADAKERLANGSSGLVGADERAAGELFVSEEEAKAQKELQDKILNSYRTYEEQKASIQEEYALYRQAAEKMGDEERIRQINEAENQALSALNVAFLKQSSSWKNLFSDLDTLSAAQISKLIKDIESQLGNADLELAPVDYKAVIDSLNQAKNTLIQKNPFKAIGTFYDDYIDAKKKLAEAKANLASGTGSEEDVQAAERDVKSATQGITRSIATVTDAAANCAQSLQGMFDALGMGGVADALGTATELMGQLGNAAMSVGELMNGHIVSGITGIVSSVSSVVGIFAKLHDKKYDNRIKELQREIDGLQNSYDRLERAFNNTYWVFSDSQRQAYEDNINLINQQIAALEQERAMTNRIFQSGKYSELTAEIKRLQNQLASAKEGDDMFGLYKQELANLEEQQAKIQQQIKAEEDKKKTDKDKIQDYKDQIEQIEQQQEDLRQQMAETLAGTDVKSAIDEFADALVDAYMQGEDAAEALGEKTKEVLKNAVVEALKRQYLAKGIEEAVEYLGSEDVWKDNKLDSNEQKHFEDMVNAAGEQFTKYLDALDGFIDDTENVQDPLEGAVASMSEETGGVIAGRLNAFIINQGDQTAVLRQALIYQSQIAQNTNGSWQELQEIKETLKRIETKDNSLLSQGIA